MSMQFKIQIVSILISAGMFAVIFELLRRKRLMERYALLWLFASAILLALAAWKGLLATIAHAIGIYYPPSALFVIAFGFILVMLLHFSLVISRLADQNKILAQRLGLMVTPTVVINGYVKKGSLLPLMLKTVVAFMLRRG